MDIYIGGVVSVDPRGFLGISSDSRSMVLRAPNTI